MVHTLAVVTMTMVLHTTLVLAQHDHLQLPTPACT